MKNDSTFPQVECISNEFTGNLSSFKFVGGLTKRELFAAMAMQGMLSNASIEEVFGWDGFGLAGCKKIAKVALTCGEALLAELAKDSK
jgi:hypothetical protein